MSGNFGKEAGAGSYGCIPFLAILGWPGLLVAIIILAILYSPVLLPHQTPEGIPTNIYYVTGDTTSGSTVFQNRVSWESYRWDPLEEEWARDDINTRADDQVLAGDPGYYRVITTFPSRVFSVTQLEEEELAQWKLPLPPNYIEH